jgi:3-vinyl bacteriochlorophyllide hydratase
MFAETVFGRMVGSLDSCPWGAATGRHVGELPHTQWSLMQRPVTARPLYTPEQRRRRDATPWTRVQGVLAPVQFLVFLVSLGLVLQFLLTGHGEQAAIVSIVVKTLVLYTIMVTGAVWERAVFGRYLFAPAFFWEDAVSMVVIALHTLYLVALLSGALDSQRLMILALAAYGTYLANAAQFVMKLRAARLAERGDLAQADYRHATHGLGHA